LLYLSFISKPTVNDNFNGKNNIVVVKKSDFEVMDALENDANQPNQNKPFQSTVFNFWKST
jgi:hypothetical protein